MPFARHSGYSFSSVSVRKNAPAWGGIYGLSNAQGWIYIDATENIQESLLAHLREPRSHVGGTATGFTFELCEANERADRCKRLIQELRPVANKNRA
jgi:hypothetical protein